MAELKVKRPTKRELYARALAESGKTMDGLEVVAFLFKSEAAQHGAHYALLLNGGVNYEIYDGWRKQAYILAAPEEIGGIRRIMTEAGGKEFKPHMKCVEIDGRTHALEKLKYDEARGGVVCPDCGALLSVGEPIGHDLHDGVNGWEIDAWPYYCENCGGEFYSEEEV